VTALAGCSSNASVSLSPDPAVPQNEVQTTAQAQLTKAVGQKAPPISCPGDLKAKLGTVMTCKIVLSGKSYDVVLTVNSVNGSDVKYDVKVGDKPSG